ncbi:Kelch repeat-containing protein [Aquimonas voraii]|uniref:Galactose oxidase, central domain n=1 Tax=Aquimonas voraii TaxID=265719 RepID=A0A1G6Y9X5_9GAMM|nr:kelch repeat-containing protein [Aquimonas voraii]SDD86537.1 Galactose oxidase, central domain [Aquimonas voraii]
MTLRLLLLCLAGLTTPALATPQLDALSRSEREACRFAVERFFAAERAAHAGEPTARAPSAARIAARVEEELRMESALAERFGRRIDAGALQAELLRIQRESRAPAQLQRLLDALNRDPRLAGECIARPGLVERLLYRRHQRTAPGSDFAEWWLSVREQHHAAEPPTLERPLFLPATDISARTAGDGSSTGVETWISDADDGGPMAPRAFALSAWNGSELFLFGGRGPRNTTRADGGLYTPAIDHWRWVSPVGAPGPRESGVAVWTGSRFLVFGGTTNGSGAQYDPLTDTWAPMSSANAPVGITRFVTGVWTGSELLVFGGEANVHARYNPVTDTWGSLPPSGLPALIPSSVWHQGRMYVWGLRSENGGATLSSRLGAFDVASNQWIPLSTVGAPAARFETAMTVVDGRIMIFGGSNGFGTVYGDGALYDPTSDSWTTLPSAGAPSARNFPTLVSTGDRAIVFGGQRQSAVSDHGAVYDAASNGWQALPGSAPLGWRSGHAAAWTGSALLVMGGMDEGGEPLRDGGLFDLASSTWTLFDGGDDLGRVRGAAAVWTGVEALLFGGRSAVTERPQRGLSWRAATDSFSPLPLQGSPSAREMTAAVWTGADMIVWGGLDDAVPEILGDGGRFDPAAWEWRSISSTTSPSPRYLHTLVWTGQHALVSGGVSALGLSADGAGYSPQGDSWTALPTEGAPAPRADATAVWTGSEMIIWGGSGAGGAPLASGARFNPQSWSWTGPTAAGPAARSNHSAVWSGSEMLIWAGTPSALPSLWRYAPLTNQWRAGPSAQPQAPLGGQTAVWSGSELLVFGGAGATGGRYDPQANVWRDLTSVGAPSTRADHAALWIGDAMLVLGGAIGQRRSLYYPNGLPLNVFRDGFEP